MKAAPVLVFIAGILLTILAILAIDSAKKAESEEDGIPLPPAGYEYCVDNSGEILGFCRKGER